MSKKAMSKGRGGTSCIPKTYPKLSRFFAPTSKKRSRSEDELTITAEEMPSRRPGTISAKELCREPEIVLVDDTSVEKDQIIDVEETEQSGSNDKDNSNKIALNYHLSESTQNENPIHEQHHDVAQATGEEIPQNNPFSQFAFSLASNSPQKQGSLTKWMQARTTSSTSGPQPPASSRKSITKKKPRTFQAGGTEWIKMEDLPKQERDKIISKWHSLADPTASLEDRRLQILVAARLHARCQEPVVRSAMASLRGHLEGDLSVQRVARSDPKDLAPVINNLQYFNAKALHIVKAAQEIKSIFGGLVPESEHLLKQLTGVGPVIADLLAYVNTRARHTARNS